MLSAARPYLRSNAYLSIFPGLAIMITIVALNCVGDGLRDALDPRQKR
jgi:peptide/nickel transport system permease protein